MKVPFLGRIPLDPEMVNCTDDGKPLVTAFPESAAAGAFREITKKWIELLEQEPKKTSFLAGLFKK
jgi:ATP-binding protein involved in chromosome partitioning